MFILHYLSSEIWAAIFFTTLAFFAAIVGQRVVRKLIGLLGRASIIIFILSFMIFISALSLGTVFPLLTATVCSHGSKLNTSSQIHRRSWDLKHDSQDRAAGVHGIREHLQI
jgi:hypothetical protein